MPDGLMDLAPAAKLGWPLLIGGTLVFLAYRWYKRRNDPLPTGGLEMPDHLSRGAASQGLISYIESAFPHNPGFVKSSFREAVEETKTKSSQGQGMMFVYLHNPTPGGSEVLSDTLCTEFVSDFLKANCVSWAGMGARPETARISTAFRVTQLPFMCILVPQGRQLVQIMRHSGPIDAPSLLVKLVEAHDRKDELIQKRSADAKVRDPSLEAQRALLAHQDQEYQEALRKDQEMQQKLKEKKEAAKREEATRAKEAARRTAATAALKAFRASQAALLPPEPEESSESGVVCVRFSNGKKVQRRFEASTPVEHIYAFVDCNPLCRSLDVARDAPHTVTRSYRLVTSHPRIVLPDAKDSLEGLGLGKSILLIVEKIPTGGDSGQGGKSVERKRNAVGASPSPAPRLASPSLQPPEMALASAPPLALGLGGPSPASVPPSAPFRAQGVENTDKGVEIDSDFELED